jgi:hypothetical protein
MKKIVIFSDSSDRSFSRAMALKALFPECEIEIRSVIPGDKKEALFTDKRQNCEIREVIFNAK